MAAHEFSSGIDLVDNIQLKVKSLETLLSEIKQNSHDDEFDPSIRDDIYAYIRSVQKDCQTVVNNNKYNLFSDHKIHNIHDDGKIIESPVYTVNDDDVYDENIQKFEGEVDFRIDEVIKSIQTTENILNVYHKENSLLMEQTNDICQKLDLQKSLLDNEIVKFNDTNHKVNKEFDDWKERLCKKNYAHDLLTNEAHKLLQMYEQKMLMVKNNIMNTIKSVSESLSLRAKCLKLEINIIWKGDTILKMYKSIDKLIEVNEQKLNTFDHLQFQMGNVSKDIDTNLNYNIIRTGSKMKNKISNQIQKHNDIKEIVEEKFRQLCTLSSKCSTTEELLVNSRTHIKNIEMKINENQKEIDIKRQQIEDENNNIKNLKNDIDKKHKFLEDTQHLIEEKRSQLKNIESENEKETKEMENKKLEMRKKQANIEIMKFIMNYHQNETKEKVQFYHNYVVRPLELKLEKCVEMIDHEKAKNEEILSLKPEIIGNNPEFKKTIENVQLQIEQLDNELKKQHETAKRTEDELKTHQLKILHQLDKCITKNEKYIDIFETFINYRTKMINNFEIKQKNTILECELFQKRYEIKKKRDKLEEEENTLKTQLNELKNSVRQQAAYNKELSKRYRQLNK